MKMSRRERPNVPRESRRHPIAKAFTCRCNQKAECDLVTLFCDPNRDECAIEAQLPLPTVCLLFFADPTTRHRPRGLVRLDDGHLHLTVLPCNGNAGGSPRGTQVRVSERLEGTGMDAGDNVRGQVVHKVVRICLWYSETNRFCQSTYAEELKEKRRTDRSKSRSVMAGPDAKHLTACSQSSDCPAGSVFHDETWFEKGR